MKSKLIISTLGLVLALATPSSAAEEEILPIVSFRLDAADVVTDFPGAFVEGQRDSDGAITQLTIGLESFSVAVDEDVYSRVPLGAIVVQISASQGVGGRGGGRTVTAHFLDRTTGVVTRVAVSEDGQAFIY